MILHLSPDAPWIARAAADTALVAHIGGGMLGIAAGFVALAAPADRRVIRSGGLTGPARIRRHLWRMCLAMFVGTGSLFIGQPKVFPEWLRGSPILWLLAFAPLAAMAFWLTRTRSTG